MKNKLVKIVKTSSAIAAIILLLLTGKILFSQDKDKSACGVGISAQENCIDPVKVTSGQPAKQLVCNQDFHKQCRKIGMNTAANGVPNNQIDGISRLNMGHELQIALVPGDLDNLAGNFNHALDQGVTPILRICAGQQCAFSNPQTYIDFLAGMSDRVGNREFYAIAGPNEPLSEIWLGGKEGDPASTAPPVASYMNTIINERGGKLAGKNIKFLSPVFNVSDPNNGAFMDIMKSSGANFAGLDAIALNAYNTTDGSITGYFNLIKGAGFGKPYFITEIGMYDAQQGTDRGTALNRLQSEIAALRNDPEVQSALLFNSLGINGDSRFKYNVLTPEEFEFVLKFECIESKLACG